MLARAATQCLHQLRKKNVCPFMFLPFNHCWRHHLLLSHSHSSALLRLLLLVIHAINNGTNIQLSVTLTVNFSLNLMTPPTRSYRYRWLHVSHGIVESQHSCPERVSSGHRTRFAVGNSLIHECSTHAPWFPRKPRLPTSLKIDDRTSRLREQHIVALITHTADGVERSGHICDLVPRAILVTCL